VYDYGFIENTEQRQFVAKGSMSINATFWKKIYV